MKRRSASLTIRKTPQNGSGATSHSWDGVSRATESTTCCQGPPRCGRGQSADAADSSPAAPPRERNCHPVLRSHFWAPSQEPKAEARRALCTSGSTADEGGGSPSARRGGVDKPSVCTHTQVHTRIRAHMPTCTHTRARTHSGVLPNLKKGALTQAVTRTSLEDVSEEA